MSQAGIRQLRDGLSTFLDEVKSGGEVVITEHGRPVAKIVPLTDDPLERLIAEGRVTRGNRRRELPDLVDAPAARLSELVMDLRGEG